MHNRLVATIVVVNPLSDDSVSHPRNTCGVETIGDRIERLRKERGWSQRELSRRAGLAETHVGLLEARFKEDPNNEVELSTLRGIAEALEVTVGWLEKGAITESHVEYDRRYPNFVATAEFLRDKVPPEVINSVVEVFHGNDLEREEWRVKILAAAADAKAKAVKTPEQLKADEAADEAKRAENRAELKRRALADDEAHKGPFETRSTARGARGARAPGKRK